MQVNAKMKINMTVSLWCTREIFKMILNYLILTGQKVLKLS